MFNQETDKIRNQNRGFPLYFALSVNKSPHFRFFL